MAKVIIVENCVNCPFRRNPHIAKDGVSIAINCGDKKDVEILTTDPIPESCNLKDLSYYGFDLKDGQIVPVDDSEPE